MNFTYNHCKQIFLKSVAAVETATLIKSSIKLHNNSIHVCNTQNYSLINKNCYVIGFGKAVLHMANEMESILGRHLAAGIVSVPVGIFSSPETRQIAMNTKKIKYIEGAKNNLPDLNAKHAAQQIADLCTKLNEDDLLFVLVSGGGSALLPLPRAGITLEEKSKLIQMLSSKGADILELNCVRKRLSVIKGGGLVKLAYPATVISLILSDIIDDPLDFIASGPTVPNLDQPDTALKIIQKYELINQIPKSIYGVLSTNMSECDLKIFENCQNFIIGNNKLATNEASLQAKRFGYQTCVISNSVSGDVNLISDTYTRISLEIAYLMKGITSSKEKFYGALKDSQSVLHISDETITELMNMVWDDGKVCLIAGGEPTVTVSGQGLGGRNQQLSLQFSVDVANQELLDGINISLLSCGTDGIDGPTDAAGAFGFSGLLNKAQAENIDPYSYLKQNDSFNFYSKFVGGKYLCKTGHTGTNVMDIHVIIIENK